MKKLLLILLFAAVPLSSESLSAADRKPLKSVGSIAEPGLYGPFWPAYGRSSRGRGNSYIVDGQVWLGNYSAPVLDSPVSELDNPIFKSEKRGMSEAEREIVLKQRQRAYHGQLPAGGYGNFGKNESRRKNGRPDIPDTPLHGSCLGPDC